MRLQEIERRYHEALHALIGPTLSYQEIVTDLHAVLTTGNLSAISKSLSVIYGHHENGRDFAKHYDLESWNDSGDHKIFAPVRSYLGRKIGQLGPENSQRIFSAVFRAAAARLNAEAANPAESQVAVPERNRRFIAAIEEELSRSQVFSEN